LRSAVEGLAFVRSRPVILALLASDGAAMLFGGYQVLLPILADEFGTGVAGFGLLSSAPAIGGLAGAIIVMYLGDFPYKGRLIVGGVLCYSFFLAGLAFAPSFALTFAMAMGLGMSDAMQAATRNALIQMLAPDALRGRVSSFQHMLTGSTPALGLSLMGAAAGVVSAPVALIAGAACCAAFNVGLLSTRRDLRARDLGQVPEVLARSG
jgi:MFS family permease